MLMIVSDDLQESGIERENLSGRSEYKAFESKLAELLTDYRAGKYMK